MQLHSNPASPFGRKVKVVAHETGQFGRPRHPHRADLGGSARSRPGRRQSAGQDPLSRSRRRQPRSTIRVSSASISIRCTRVRRSFRPPAPSAGMRFGCRRWPTASWMRRCSRATRASCGPRSMRWPAWIDGQLDKVHRGLDRLEATEAAGFGGQLDIGTIATACALGYLDFRFPRLGWRSDRPLLAAWFEDFAERPSMQATRPELSSGTGCAPAAARRAAGRPARRGQAGHGTAQRDRQQSRVARR